MPPRHRRFSIYPTLGSKLILVVLIIVSLWSLVLCRPTRAQKKYIFRPGSRQAIEVPASQAVPSSQHTGGMYRRSGMTVHQGSRHRGGMTLRTAPGPARQRRSATSSKKRKSSSSGRAYNFTDQVLVNGLKRKYFVYVPASYRRSRPIPLVMVFHGLKMSAESMTAVTGLNGVGARNNFVVVYAQAVQGRWNDGMNNKAGISDIGYVQAMLKKVSSMINVDRHRIYAVGLSNGGYFVQILARALDDQIAAVAVVGSTAMEQGLNSFKVNRPIPIVFFMGSDDALINWDDGRSRGLGKYAGKVGIDSLSAEFYSLASRYGGWMSAPKLLDYWVRNNGCSPSPRRFLLPDKDRADGTRVEKLEFGSRGNAVILYKIKGGGHSWPGAIQLPGLKHRSCQDIEASEEIWRFFKENAR